MRPPLRVGTVYDFRNTPESGMDMPSLYAAIMDQVVMRDGLGLGACPGNRLGIKRSEF